MEGEHPTFPFVYVRVRLQEFVWNPDPLPLRLTNRFRGEKKTNLFNGQRIFTPNNFTFQKRHLLIPFNLYSDNSHTKNKVLYN